MSRRVLITGAGGFVGSALAEGFIAEGWSVTALDIAFDPSVRGRLSGATLVEAALTAETLARLGACDLVIHAAAITTAAEEMGVSPLAHVRANCDLLLDTLDHATRSGARDFVFLSSSGVFGDSAVGPFVESTPALATHPYAVAKRAGEVLVTLPAGIRVIAVRLGPIYGPHETSRATRKHVSPVREWVDAATKGGEVIVTSPRSVRDWTWAPDLPGALLALLALRPEVSGIVHLTSGQISNDKDLAATIADHFGVRCRQQDAGDPPRRPMQSERVDLAALYPWTPIEAGLGQLMGVAA
jgi:nucleoside-diphosphate-sugar epimerase